MGTSHTELSQVTHNEDPGNYSSPPQISSIIVFLAGVFCPHRCWLSSVSRLPLCPGCPPHLHPSCHQARGEGGRGSREAHNLRYQGDWLHKRLRVCRSLPG